ncbi:hypothetical protein B296_00017977 [Ensete ventricosum]|uniref:MACPF domain-containing protein n=1 Tax=Ensete ventricosum TaxID=4639 RepID=A0A427B384_ENSVE|nr:hypothetical protein B296_00017977 [Ensete ventricosum]
MALRISPLKAAEIAINSIGLGYDIAGDIRLKHCKRDSSDPWLIEIDHDQVHNIVLPGGLSIPNVPKSIKCDKGERIRFRSDVLSFQQELNVYHFSFSSRFIERFGTHIITGVKMGGKDVIYIKQQHSSNLQPIEVQKRLKELADKRFQETSREYDVASKETYGKDKVFNPHFGLLLFPEQRLRYKAFLICGFCAYCCNYSYIYLWTSDKPPIEELHQFLEFQLPRQWAPVYSDLPLGPHQKQQSTASLQFSFMGPKLHVNTSMVDVGKKPVTGLRLYLEGKRSNRLAIHLQHLCSLPQIFELRDNPRNRASTESYDRKYYEPVDWRHFSHVCTAPVEVDDDDLSIVTGAQLHVSHHGFKKVLFLRLQFLTVSNAALVKNAEWDNSPNLVQKSGLISTLISTHFSAAAQKPPPRPTDVNINSAVYPGGPPVPVQTPKLLKFVDTTEMVRGPQDSPGYWVVSGAKLNLERGKISLRVRYSLLTAMLPDEDFE